MKVGDLVKFKAIVRGHEKLVGIIIGENNAGLDVLWSAIIHAPGGIGGDSRIQTEHREFLEVISESR
jgi:hypothetical protein